MTATLETVTIVGANPKAVKPKKVVKAAKKPAAKKKAVARKKAPAKNKPLTTAPEAGKPTPARTPMATKKQSKKRVAKKAHAKASVHHAAPAAPAKRRVRHRAKKAAPAAAAPASHEKRHTGQFVSKDSKKGSPGSVTVRRSKKGRFENVKTRKAGTGKVETITVRRNPKSVALATLGAISAGGVGYFAATMLDRWLATRVASDAPEGAKPATGATAEGLIGSYSWRRFAAAAGLSAVVTGGSMYLAKKPGMLRTGLIGLGLGAGVKAGADLITKYLAPRLFSNDKSEFAQRYFPEEIRYNKWLEGDGMVWGIKQPAPQRALGAAPCGGCGSSLHGAGCGCATCRQGREVNLAKQLAALRAAQAQPKLEAPKTVSGAPTSATPAANVQTMAFTPNRRVA